MNIVLKGLLKAKFANWFLEDSSLLPGVFDVAPYVVIVTFVSDSMAPYGAITRSGDVVMDTGVLPMEEFKGALEEMILGRDFLDEGDRVMVRLPATETFPDGTTITLVPPMMEIHSDVTAIVCISTEKMRSDMDAEDPRIVHVLAEPDFTGYSNAEEFITMQHVKHKEGHPIVLGWAARVRNKELSEDIKLWLERTKSAVRHTLMNPQELKF